MVSLVYKQITPVPPLACSLMLLLNRELLEFLGVLLCAGGGVTLKSVFQLKEAFKADPLGCDGMIRCPLPTTDGFSSCETKVSRTPPRTHTHTSLEGDL